MNSPQADNGRNDFDVLCAHYLDGTLDEAGRDQLADLLESDPAAIEALRAQLLVSGALARLRPELSNETFLRTVLPHLGKVADEEEDAFPNRVKNTIRFQRWKRTALVAAAVVTLAGGVTFLMRQQDPSRSSGPGGDTVVATRFDDDQPSREVRTGEKLVISNGITRMEFTNGAVIAIEAPAEISIRSADEVVLDHGRLNAWCPETAHGFRVVTTTATLTDLGTSFGVSAAHDGTTDFVVLDGKVEVEKDHETRQIERGAAVRAKRGTRLSELAFEPSPFHRTWPVASGIRSTRGEVVPAPPGTPEALAAMENDTQILVIPERRDFKPGGSIPVDIMEPGLYEGQNLMAAYQVTPPAGTRVRSYLLRYNPLGQLKERGTRRFEGSVTFDRPVLGIITFSRKLNRTDAMLSRAPLPKVNVQDTGLRGLERGPTPADRVELSQDRRTITVTFFADQSVDEIRAITED